MDSGDSPVSGLAFTIEGPGGEQEVTTDAEGLYSMEDLYPGKYALHFGLNADTILPGGHEDSANEWSIELAILDGESLQKDIPVLVLGSISGAVWNLDGENDQINDLPIRLWLDGKQLAETASDRNGRYRFDRLYPGEYTLEAELPEDYVFARVQDTSSRMSVIQNTGAEKIVLHMGQNAEDQDIGIGAIGAIGDFVWLDENKNGLQDIGEPGVPGIEITLKQYGFETSHVTTDAYGLYEILHLYPGVYQVCVDLPAEVMGTRQRSDFALVSSVLPENCEGHVEFEITVPSGTSNLNIDMGLALKQDGVYPQNMDDVPTRDWTPYTDRR